MKKRNKILLLVLAAIITITMSIIGYRNYLPNPKTNLEFIPGEQIKHSVFKDHSIANGGFGCVSYFGEGYIPLESEEGYIIFPEIYVVYTMTTYKDFLSNRYHICGIEITDPNIEIYGLNCQSSREEVIKVLKRKGFKIEETSSAVIGTRGIYRFGFSDNHISLFAHRSNPLYWGVKF